MARRRMAAHPSRAVLRPPPGTALAPAGRGQQKEALGCDDLDLIEAGPIEGGLQFGRFVEDLSDAEAGAVAKMASLGIVLRRSMIPGARLGVRSRVDKAEQPSRHEPSSRQAQELVQTRSIDVADPETGEEPVHGAVGLGPGVPDLDLSVQPCRLQPPPG